MDVSRQAVGEDGAQGVRHGRAALIAAFLLLPGAMLTIGADEPPAAEAPPPESAARRPYFWESSASFEIQTYRRDRSDWYRWATGVRRKFDGGSVALEQSGTRRFDIWDEAAAVDAWKNLWDHAYVNARVQIAHDAEILPRLDLSTELFQGIGKGWEVSGSYRHMDFPGSNADIYGVCLGKYLGNWYLRGRYSQSAGTSGRGGSTSVWARRYLANEKDFIELGAGTGRQVVSLGEGRNDEVRGNTFMSLRAQHFFTDRIGLSASLSYGDEEKVAPRVGYGLSIVLRW